MPETSCISCKGARTVSHCEVCEGALCKTCVQFLDPLSFSFLKEIPEVLAHVRYCRFCYDEKVAPPLESYREILERAQNVFIFFSSVRKDIVTKRSKVRVQVDACPDRDETILRLAFFAAELGFNAVIEVEVKAEKVRNAGYQKSKWQGIGLPAQVDETKVDREHQQDKEHR